MKLNSDDISQWADSLEDFKPEESSQMLVIIAIFKIELA